MSSNSIGQIVGGVVGAVAGFFVAGPAGALYGFTLGAVAGGLLFPPEQEKGDLRPDELQFTNSTEAQSTPVIFGTVRVPGNHIGYDPDSFKVVEETAEGGKGGGQEQVTGYKYKLTYDVGLCMGEVDALVKVSGSPGEDNMLWTEERITIEGNFTFSAAGNTITRTDSSNLSKLVVGQDIQVSGAATEGNNGECRITALSTSVITVAAGSIPADEVGVDLEIIATTFQPAQDFSGASISETFTGLEDRGDGGTVVIHPGTSTQSRADGDNHRGICFAAFGPSFNMGGSAAPRSYLFTLRRMPRVRNSAGATISTIPVRASDDPNFPEYEDANPAAVVWEIFTQGFNDGTTVEASWGKGMSPDKLNQADFELAAEYFEANRLGISTSLGGGSAGIRDLLSKLRDLFGLLTWWDGEQLRCRVYWDRDNAYSPRTRITEEDIVGEVAFARPSQAATSNEVRLEFTNRRNNHQKEAITLQDLGHAETVGAIRSESFQSKEVGTRRAGHLIASRLLRSLAYPAATVQFKTQRQFAHLQPGDFVELVWNTWRSGAVTSFWRVLQIQDDETSDNSVELTLEEDQFATARDGEISDFTLPIISVDVDVPLDDGDFGLIDYAAGSPIGEITPVFVDEPSIWVSKGSRRLVAGVTRRNGGLQSISVGWSETPFTDYTSLGVIASFPISGTISGNGLDTTPASGFSSGFSSGFGSVASHGPKIIRNTRPDEFFDVALTISSDDVSFLAATSTVGDENDDFSLLTAAFNAIMIVGTEVIRVGLAEEDTPGIFTIKNAIRGEFGTEIQSHPAATPFFFFPLFDFSIHSIPAMSLPLDVAAKARVQGFTGRTSSDPVIVSGPDAGTWNGRSIDPLPFSLYSVTRVGFVWTVKVRPRIHDGGANFGPNLESEFQSREPDLGALLARVTASTGDSILLGSFFVSGSESDGDMTISQAEYVPSDGTNPTTGLITFVLTFTSNPTDIDFFSTLNGRNGDALNIPQPA